MNPEISRNFILKIEGEENKKLVGIISCRHCGLKKINTTYYDNRIDLETMILSIIQCHEGNLLLHLMECEKYEALR